MEFVDIEWPIDNHSQNLLLNYWFVFLVFSVWSCLEVKFHKIVISKKYLFLAIISIIWEFIALYRFSIQLLSWLVILHAEQGQIIVVI